MFGFSSSELVLVALIVGLVLLAGRVGAWGEALGRLGARSSPRAAAGGPSEGPAGDQAEGAAARPESSRRGA